MATTVEPQQNDVDQDENNKKTGDTPKVEVKSADSWPTPVLSSARSALGKFLSRTDSNEATKRKKRKHRDPRTIERSNLLNVAKLIIKELIDSSMAHGRMLDDDHEPLQQFFVVLEHVLRHGLRPKKSILRDRRDFWCVLELVEKFVPEASEITHTVRDMPHLKTPLGKARAWLRLAAMQKTLADYVKVLIEKRDFALSEFYEPGSIMLEDEGAVIAGLLVGLNVIDCNLGIKDEDLDQPMGVIDFSLYLKNSRLTDNEMETDSAEVHEKMQTILDQKNYLEELNRHLNATVANLQQKLEMANTTNALMKEDLAIAKNTIIELEEAKTQAELERDTILSSHKQQIEAQIKDEQTCVTNTGSDSIAVSDDTQDTVDTVGAKTEPSTDDNLGTAVAKSEPSAIDTYSAETETKVVDELPETVDHLETVTVNADNESDSVNNEITTDEHDIGKLGSENTGIDADDKETVRNQTDNDTDNYKTDADKADTIKNEPVDVTSENVDETTDTAKVTSEPAKESVSVVTQVAGLFKAATGLSKNTKKEAKKDIDVERQTYKQSQAGLDEMYADAKKRLEEEIQLRLDVEKELELQIGMKQEIEMAMGLLEKDIHEKQDSIIGLRKQLDELKVINLQMYSKLETCDTSLKHKTEMVTKLEEKTNNLVSVLKEMEKKLKQSESDKQAAEETARKLGQTIAEKDTKRTALETDLRIEREWRGNLQKNLEQEKLKMSSAQNELHQLQQVQALYAELQKQHRDLQVQFEDQERTLAELGSHLSESKLRVEDMKELQMVNKEATWTSDKDATLCKQCEKPFSVARRKHHCRNCGDIFCAECSDNKMPHPSSSKPVRVCDTCQDVLLQRYSASGN